jgi:hypothetical protein
MRAAGLLTLLAGLLALMALAAPAQAAELPPYQLNPLLSLRGNCSVSKTIDPVPDPSCVGQPPEYPPPPGRPLQFERPGPIAIDSYGNEYVLNNGSFSNGDERVDVFDDEGRFIVELATPSELLTRIAVDGKGNLYTFDSHGNVLRYAPSTYKPEVGEIVYGNPPVEVSTGPFTGAVAIDASNDHLFVARAGTIEEYGAAAEVAADKGNTEIGSFPVEGSNGWNSALAVDGQRGRIFVSGCKKANEECFVRVLEADAPHATLAEIDGSSTPAGKFNSFSGRLPTAVDEETGHFFIGDLGVKWVYEFGEDFSYSSRLTNTLFQSDVSGIAISNGKNASGDAFNRHFLFVSTNENGRVLAFEPPGVLAPEVQVSVASVSETEATLQAKVSPNGGETSYAFEYTTQAAFEAEGFTGAQLVGKGTIPSAGLPANRSVPLGGLTPGGSYRFRVVAENEAGKAEPISEATFTTYKDAPVSGECPNQGLRTGASSALPDCRAYELVTPPDTNGRRPKGTGFSGSIFPTLQASPEGGAVSFRIEGGSLPGTTGVGSLDGDPYRAARGPSGWASALAGPSGDEATATNPGSTSPDQGYAFWRSFGEGPLGPEGSIYSEYLHYPDGHSELIGRGSEGIDPTSSGKLITEGGGHVIFSTENESSTKPVKLEPDAPPTGTTAVYDRTIDPVSGVEQTHVASLLPGDLTPTSNATYRGASADGEGIAFEIGGTLYIRKDNTTTYEIGTEVTFAGVSAGGERIFYVEGGDLKAFDTATEGVIEFSDSGDVTPVNVASGGARAYFVSPSALGGTNPQGDSAQPGGQNLYLSEEGQVSFVATVTDRDVEGGETADKVTFDGLGLWAKVLSGQLAFDPSRTNPDGTVALFQSRANLTGYDPQGSPQVYRYDGKEGSLQCVSCGSTGAPAGGGAAIQSYAFGTFEPPPLSTGNFVPALTPDGDRAFFESTEALVSTDTDGVRDVYEWEAQGVGSCKEAGGCVYLISSGNSATDNYLFAHSTDGSDVFFTTGDQLTGEDTSPTPSVYDARVGGGFATTSIAGECLGEACLPTVAAPGDPIPVLEGSGNPREPTKARCQKPKRKVKRAGKTRCVKPKKAKKHNRKASNDRRAGR